MKMIEDAVRYPVSTTVGVILLVLFGTIGLMQLPIQLTPEVHRPEITVTTVWPGASPQEVERDIVDEQEEQLKSVEGLVRMRSNSSDSFGQVTLAFEPGTDIDTALIKVSNVLGQVPDYPVTVEKPILTTTNADAHAMAWLILRPLPENGYEGDVTTLYNFADDFIKPAFERVKGVALSNIYGGKEREMQVIVDPARLAAHRVTLNQLGAAVERENRNYSGGDFDEGKRRYVVRTVGEYGSPEEVESVVVAMRNGVPVYLRDVARAELGYRDPGALIYHMSKPVLALNAIPQSGANVIDAMSELKTTITALQTDLLSPRGLELVQVYDQTEYIESSIGLVRQSLVVGGILAITILLLFLRSATSTLVVGVSIPVSLIGTFLVMWLFGRTVNVVSLAGMAFAVGMVVDNSIVVLENIYRHRQMGKRRRAAAVEGSTQVWGAVLASTLTTMAVFIPVAFIKEEAGQLFGDIAIAIAASVGLSLLVSITVIPSLSAKILQTAAAGGGGRSGFSNLWGGTRRAEAVPRGIGNAVHWITASTTRRLTVIVVLAGLSVGLSWWLMPATDYLPQGNQNFLFGRMLPPPGYSIEEVADLRKIYADDLSDLWSHPAGSPEAEALPGGGIQDFFFGSGGAWAFMGVSANDPMRVRELLPGFYEANAKIPGAFAFIQQSSIFQSGFGEGRSIEIDLVGPDLIHLIELGGEVYGRAKQLMPNAQIQPIPGLDLGNPEVQVAIHRRRHHQPRPRLRRARPGRRRQGERLPVRRARDRPDGEGGGRVRPPHSSARADADRRAGRPADHPRLGGQHRATQRAGRHPAYGAGAHHHHPGRAGADDAAAGRYELDHQFDHPADDRRGEARWALPRPSQRHRRQARADRPGDGLDLPAGAGHHLSLNGVAVRELPVSVRHHVQRAAGGPRRVHRSGADQPRAALGGFIGLALINFVEPQPLDVITMLGFIILVGTVVNNAILVVHQSLNHMRDEGMAPREAIREATISRVRPIFMTVGTSTFGMLPLVLFPGAGSELYRGLGSVVVGGLIVSTLFTLFLVPAVFSLMLDVRTAIANRLRRQFRAEEPATTGPAAGA
jgi:HAE1 family hydrophobic/amphiphilic exporter-1